MLLRFRVANHRSIRQEQELSLVATEFNEGTARATGVRADGREVKLLPVAGIYGANASGKSNVLLALQAMQEAVSNSLATWARGEGVPREPFALFPEARDETTLFEVDLLLGVDPVRHTYGFELSDGRVEAEWLHAFPFGRQQIWFDRDASREAGEAFRFPEKSTMHGTRKEKEQLAEFTRPNSLLLTVAASLNHPQLSIVHRWFLSHLSFVLPGPPSTARILGELANHAPNDRIIELLRKADLGITGIQLETRPRTQVRLLHQQADGTAVPLDLHSQESRGTLAWFSFLGPALQALDSGSVLLIDELDASLHPTLAAELINLFRDRDANRHHAQLIFTTHDATLLGSAMVERTLDRDEVWITSKQRTGETELYPLIDAKPRKEENLERGYLRGRYGGVPRISHGDMAREVVELREAA